MDYSLAEKQAVHEVFEILLDALDVANREPDRWEEDCLSHSLTAMACGSYRLAAVELQIFSTPLQARTPESLQYLSTNSQRFTKELLRRALHQIKTIAIECD